MRGNMNGSKHWRLAEALARVLMKQRVDDIARSNMPNNTVLMQAPTRQRLETDLQLSALPMHGVAKSTPEELYAEPNPTRRDRRQPYVRSDDWEEEIKRLLRGIENLNLRMPKPGQEPNKDQPIHPDGRQALMTDDMQSSVQNGYWLPQRR
jgi:hypothetical protein